MLDVNSPLPNQHLNRYEPWTTYNENYLEHVFKIVDQFSAYNNTLGFFSGNEIVNDRKSARNSPVFIKRLISDMKRYIANHSDRIVPVGYSAADDLNYRISLSKYLECCDDATISDAVDFYGVNTYQWCGEQTFYTSGYDILVRDYENYVRPVFFSEFGCNLVSPRTFEEIGAMYSDDMVGVFSGGLVYEFSEEQNKYGLVFINEKGNVRLLEDYDALKIQYSAVEYPTGRQISDLYSRNGKKQQLGAQALPVCELEYDNIEISGIVEHSISELLLKNGVDVKKGKFVKLKNEDLYTTYNISNSDGTPFERNKFVKVVNLVHGITEYEALKLQQLQNEGKYPIHIEAGPEYHVNTIMKLIAEC